MNYLKSFVTIVATFFIVIFLISLGSLVNKIDPHMDGLEKDSILKLDLDGVILDSETFIENLRKYAKKDHIKGVLIKVNSPGGAVGPSQELYSEILRTREELKKPVVVSGAAVVASGAYYAAVAADQIVTNPGTLMGSIGVIMEFANLEKLYDWAKVRRYVIKSGAFKDAGSEHRPMTSEERELFQSMIDEVHDQFKLAVAKGRKLSEDVVNKYADGRVFTGEAAVKLGFADQIGTSQDALRLVGELSGLGTSPEVFTPPKKRPEFFELLAESMGFAQPFEKALNKISPLSYSGQPMFLMPGYFGE